MRRDDDGFTLIEVLVVTAIVVIVAGTLGTFFLAGASPAVAAAERDVTAAFDEARRTAIALDAATVVFTPVRGGGYSARVYRSVPGDPAFAPRNGPDYADNVTIAETASPLGAPAFALSVDSGGTVTGFANYAPGAASYVARPCPPAGTFTLQLLYERDARSVTIPCSLAPSSTAALTLQTPTPAYTPSPFPLAACPAGASCSLPPVAPAPSATCPPGYAADASIAGQCDAVAPPPAVTPTPAPGPLPTAASTSTPVPASTPAGMIERYSAAADGFSAHISTLFADGSICDDGGCSVVTAIAWTWACPAAARGGSTGNDGSNAPYQPDTSYGGSVSSTISAADHNAAEGNGDGLVWTEDSYCVGFPDPSP